MKTEITSAEISNLEELQAFCREVLAAVPQRTTADTVYLASPIRLTLVKERLTDRSHVYDIHSALVLR